MKDLATKMHDVKDKLKASRLIIEVPEAGEFSDGLDVWAVWYVKNIPYQLRRHFTKVQIEQARLSILEMFEIEAEGELKVIEKARKEARRA